MCSPALGDTLLFSSVLQDLRAHFDAAGDGAKTEIVHICMPSSRAAAEVIPGADRRLIIDLVKPRATLAALRAERFDALFDFSSWQRLTAFYAMASGARFTAGFRTPGQHRSRGYDVTTLHRDDRHEVDNFRALLDALHIPTGAPPAIDRAALVESDLPTGDFVVFHPWASGQRSWLREWPGDRWIELARRLARPGTRFLVTGAPSDLPRTEPFVASLRAAGLDAEPFVGTDGFRSLAGMLRRARLVVSVNTGVMHLAAMVGAPTVSINGPNRNGRWGPIGPRAVGVEAPGDGCGYLHLGFNFDGHSTDCMERITVVQVLDAVNQVLATPTIAEAR